MEMDVEKRHELIDQALKFSNEQNSTLSELKIATQLLELDRNVEHEERLRSLLAGIVNADSSWHVQRALAALN